jgi:hypothetical protein
VNNTALQTIAGFTTLGQIGSSLTIRDSDVLTHFNGLDSLVSISLDVVVVANPVLNTIAGLRSGTLTGTTALGNNYQIAGNPALSACEVNALRTTLNVTGGRDLSGANSGCTSCSGASCAGTAGGTEGQAGAFTGAATIVNTADLAWMRNVVNLTGALTINATTLTQINNLANLRTVGGGLSIQNNTGLSNLTGLAGLQTVGGDVYINTNSALSSIGLSSLMFVGGYFNIYNNDAVTNLGALTALTTVEGYVNIEHNQLLVHIDGLSNLTFVGTTTSEGLTISQNPGLNSILGLINPLGRLQTLTGNLSVTSNAILNSCQPIQLRNQLQAGGWNRAFAQSGNQTCTGTCSGVTCN